MPVRSHLQAHNFIIDAACWRVIQLQLGMRSTVCVTESLPVSPADHLRKVRVLSRSLVKLLISVQMAGEAPLCLGSAPPRASVSV